MAEKGRGISVASLVWVLVFVSVSSAQHVIYVDADATGNNDGSDWTDAFVELQSVLTDAQAGDEIWVAEGTYRPDYDVGTETHTGSREATFQLISGVGIYGGFEGADFGVFQRCLSGAGIPADPSCAE